jgi:hypothetical protein
MKVWVRNLVCWFVLQGAESMGEQRGVRSGTGCLKCG